MNDYCYKFIVSKLLMKKLCYYGIVNFMITFLN